MIKSQAFQTNSSKTASGGDWNCPGDDYVDVKRFCFALFAHSYVADVWIAAEECRDNEEYAWAGESVGRCGFDERYVSRNDEGEN